ADDRPQHRAGPDRGAGVAAGDAALFVSALAVVPALLARDGNALGDGMHGQDARAVGERLGGEGGGGPEGEEGGDAYGGLLHGAPFGMAFSLNAHPPARLTGQ